MRLYIASVRDRKTQQIKYSYYYASRICFGRMQYTADCAGHAIGTTAITWHKGVKAARRSAINSGTLLQVT